MINRLKAEILEDEELEKELIVEEKPPAGSTLLTGIWPKITFEILINCLNK